MPKKKTVINGFSLYMHELKEEYRKRGQNISLAQMSHIAAPLWKEFSAEKKEDYNKKAKAQRKGQVATAQKLASDGTNIDENFREIEAEQQMEQLMRLEVSEYIGANEICPEIFKGAAAMQTHYIMAVNVLCKSEDVYIPVEIGIARYSVKYGIMEVFHKIIDPKQIPPGRAGEAKAHSDETHKLMFSKDVVKESDYRKMWRELTEFLTPSDDDSKWPPIFTLEEGIRQTVGCLVWLANAAEIRMPQEFKVWNLEYLLYDLRAGVGESLLSLTIAKEHLLKNTYDYSPGTRCDFHEDLDSVYCALGMAKRLCYLMSDCLCNVFDVELTGSHLPYLASAVKNYHVLASSRTPSAAESTVPRPTRYRSGDSYSSVLSDFSRSTKSNYDALDDFEEPNSKYLPALGRGLALSSKPVTSVTDGMNQLKLTVDMGKGVGRGRPLGK